MASQVAQAAAHLFQTPCQTQTHQAAAVAVQVAQAAPHHHQAHPAQAAHQNQTQAQTASHSHGNLMRKLSTKFQEAISQVKIHSIHSQDKTASILRRKSWNSQLKSDNT